MGNAGSSNLTARERQKSGDMTGSAPISPNQRHSVGANAAAEGQAFVFDSKKPPDTRGIIQQISQDDDETYYTTKSNIMTDSEFNGVSARPRSNTVSEGASRTNSSESENAANAEGDKKPALPTVFKWDGGGKQVYISGTFSNWKALPMVRSHGDFVTIIDLPEGDHQYKFYVDGEWRHDPKLKNIENEAGTKNNLVSVRQSDFEVFQALAKDSEDAANQAQKEYSQDIPQIKPWEKISGPPVLPPHLLQVILNKDTPLSCEPTLLPEPNHVMLNHLYALSIKDGVMVLSATHRYRKKYVTTLLYKPI
ncbi:5'-AMP-activated protein kinase subunit beta-1 [Condylostylus longicornis]|uniref:5'-AMP-activated protein kinase subunit beta-1 n=1 Tax=Condylostylus longicornis TaxID=2530218 RepID=UPI00244DE22B|nr:5'-AMP-activated protein kinase subunit beta-1 [Condylostylus longicornis]